MTDRPAEQGTTSPPEGPFAALPRRASGAPPHGAAAAPLAVGLGCALLATAFGWAAGWSLIAIAGGYVLGGMTGVLAGGLAVMVFARRT